MKTKQIPDRVLEDSVTENGNIKIYNSQLGELLIRKNSIIHFKQGILGYEFLHQFALVEVEDCKPFIWCISLDEPEIGFPILNYKITYPDYQLTLSDKDREDLKLQKSEHFHLFFIVRVDEQKKEVTANLKGPLVFNMKKMLGTQVVVQNEEYVVNYSLTSGTTNDN